MLCVVGVRTSSWPADSRMHSSTLRDGLTAARVRQLRRRGVVWDDPACGAILVALGDETARGKGAVRLPPVRVDKAPLSEWPAAERWRAVDEMGVPLLDPGPLPFKRSDVSHMFNVVDDMPLNDVDIGPYARVARSPPDVLHSAAARFFYLNERVSVLGPLYEQDVGDVQPFSSEHGAGEVHVWLGQAGVQAHVHYDTSHNFYLQILGRKRFVMAEHGDVVDTAGAPLYPSLHALYRQLFKTVRMEHLASRGVDIVDIELGPGQVLYVPPYWFHEVTALDDSISLNVWSPSRTFVLSEQAFTAPLPFEAEWPLDVRLATVGAYLGLVCKHVDPSWSECPQAIGASMAARLRLGAGHVIDFGSAPVPQVDGFDERAASTAGAFREMPTGPRLTYLVNFAENMLWWAVDFDRERLLARLVRRAT